MFRRKKIFVHAGAHRTGHEVGTQRNAGQSEFFMVPSKNLNSENEILGLGEKIQVMIIRTKQPRLFELFLDLHWNVQDILAKRPGFGC